MADASADRPSFRRQQLPVLDPGDEPRPARVTDVLPRPREEHEQAVAEALEVHEVDERPEEPGGEARQLQPADAADRGRAPDRREAPLVAVVERLRRLAADAAQDV